MIRLKTLITTIGLFSSISAAAQTFPSPPQSASAFDGTDAPGIVRLPAGASGGVDAFAACRWITNSDSEEEIFDVSTSAAWQSWRQPNPTAYAMQVCCRPTVQTVTLCKAASGGPVLANVVGPQVNGYQTAGGTGTATALCTNEPFGTYIDTETFNCGITPGMTVADVAADGVWTQVGGDTETCSASSDVTYGACSQSCSTAGSVGFEYETEYNTCGQVTSQGYFGPTCNNQSCCTPVYTHSCDQSSGDYIQTDTKCGGGSVVVGACTYKDTTTNKSCPGFGTHSYPDGTCTDNYQDCALGAWGCGVDTACNDGCSFGGCVQTAATETCNGVTTQSGFTCPVHTYSCTHGSYVAP